MNFLVIAIGAAVGAILRWQLSLRMAAVLHQFPMGTLVANLVGGFLAGVASAFFASHPSLSPQWRLLVVTGFLGGLTTFSTFSAESMDLLQKGDYLLALTHIALHLFGSILLCIAGFASYRAIA